MSSDERIDRFLGHVCRHLYWPPYRARVRRELTDHILTHAAYLHEQRGEAWDEAVDRALSALGEPNELGRSLRHARFPVPYVLCILLTGLVWAAIAACVVYLMMMLIQ